MNGRLDSLRRRGTRRCGPLALLLLLVAPLCAAACGMHAADMPLQVEAEQTAHGDCHGVAAQAEAASADADDCCDAQETTISVERAPSLPDAVIAFTGAAFEPLAQRPLPPPRTIPPDPGGRSPGRILLLLVLSFLE